MSIVNIVKEPEYYYPAGMAEQDGLMTYQEYQKLNSIPTPSNIVTKSSTAGLLKNDGTVDSNSYVKKSDIETEKTATGNPITLTDAIAGNAIEVSAEIVASQDLHGYDKPWVGGAGINKLPLVLADIKAANTSGTWSDNVYTLNGGTFTVNTDSDGNVTDITANGTFTANSDFNLAPKGNYNALNGLVLYAGVTCSTSTYTIYCAMRVSPWTAYAYLQNVSSVTISNVPNDSNTGFFIRVFAGSVSNVAFKPMVATAGISSFYPYTNICPITGFSSVVITDVDAESQTATVTVALGQTVYGGTLDLTSGELTITHAIVDLSELTWNYNSSGSAVSPYFYASLSDIKYRGDFSAVAYPFLSSQYVSSKRSSTYFLNGCICADGNTSLETVTQIQIKDNRYTDPALFKSAMSGVQLVYELATPITATLTPEQLALVKGYNQLSCNSGDMSITYKASSLDAWKERVNELDDRVDELEDAVEDIEDRVDDVETALAGKANVEPYLEQSVTLSTSQTTTVTFTDARILATSFIEPAISVWGIFPEDVTVVSGSCTVVMPKVSSAQTVTVGIFIKR